MLGMEPRTVSDPHGQELVRLHRYFHGGSEQGVGVSHQRGGWR